MNEILRNKIILYTVRFSRLRMDVLLKLAASFKGFKFSIGSNALAMWIASFTVVNELVENITYMRYVVISSFSFLSWRRSSTRKHRVINLKLLRFIVSRNLSTPCPSATQMSSSIILLAFKVPARYKSPRKAFSSVCRVLEHIDLWLQDEWIGVLYYGF